MSYYCDWFAQLEHPVGLTPDAVRAWVKANLDEYYFQDSDFDKLVAGERAYIGNSSWYDAQRDFAKLSSLFVMELNLLTVTTYGEDNDIERWWFRDGAVIDTWEFNEDMIPKYPTYGARGKD